MSHLEARLQYLERREEANTRDNIRLKTEFVELQAKFWDLKQENTKALEKLEEMETDLKRVFGFREDIDKRLATLESKVTHREITEDRMSTLETVMNEVKQDVCNANQYGPHYSVVEMRLKNVEKCVNDTERVIKDRLVPLERKTSHCHANIEQRFEKIEKDISGYHQSLRGQLKQADKNMPVSTGCLKRLESSSKESRRVCQSLSDKLKTMERQIQQTERSVLSLTEIQNSISQSAVHVELKLSRIPKVGDGKKLDKCVSIYTNSGLFNEASSTFEPSLNGLYFVSADLCQAETGSISLFIQTSVDGKTDGDYVGKTCSNNDVCVGVRIFKLKKGDKVWLEIEREEGNAYVSWSTLTAFRISPLPT